MKSAKQFADEFCNRYVLPTRGAGEVEDFVREIQADALANPPNTRVKDE